MTINKIMVLSNSPMDTTAYAGQCAMLLRKLAAAGYDMACTTFARSAPARVMWEGIPLYPAGQAKYGEDVVFLHAKHFGADLVITLMDAWAFDPAYVPEDVRLAQWTPCDVAGGSLGLSVRELAHWQQLPKAVPIAMTEHGQGLYKAAGFKAAYIPHGIDTAVFRPMDRKAIRKATGVPPDGFVFGLCAANKEDIRKLIPEQFEAFRRVAAQRDDVWLAVHTLANSGQDLDWYATNLGISDRVLWAPQYDYISGQISGQDMAAWYNAIDVLTACSAGEGFGLPIAEAQACGTPVITTDAGAMAEVAGYKAAWLVRAEPIINPAHRAWWALPRMDEMTAAFETAATRGPAWHAKRRAAVGSAARYDADRVLTEYWLPFLEGIDDSATTH
jgi:glycosyltransferase involved in cell wall biosynthesis